MSEINIKFVFINCLYVNIAYSCFQIGLTKSVCEIYIPTFF